jgi:hypothetical protein
MRLEPCCKRGRFAIGQEINRLPSLSIDQNRAIAVPFVESPVIQAHDPWGRGGGTTTGADTPQEESRTDRPPQLTGQFAPGFTAERST